MDADSLRGFMLVAFGVMIIVALWRRRKRGLWAGVGLVVIDAIVAAFMLVKKGLLRKESG